MPRAADTLVASGRQSPGPVAARGQGGGALRWTLRAAAAVLVVAAALVVGRTAGAYVPAFAAWVQSQGTLGPLVFVGGYALATVALVPGSLLSLAAGAVFGVAAGATYVFAGAVIGSSLAFLIGRYLARAAVEQRLARDTRFARIDRAVAREGRRIVLLMRLSPVLPFNLLNYALGLTRVRFPDFVVASVGMIPGTLLYVYSGRVVGDLAAVAAGAGPERGAAYYVVLGLGLAATVVVTFWVTRIARRALQEEEAVDGH